MGCDFLCCGSIIDFLMIIGTAIGKLIYNISNTIFSEQFIGIMLTAIIGANYKAIGNLLSKFISSSIQYFIKWAWSYIVRLGKPYYTKKDISKALHDLKMNIETRPMVIRVGKLSLNASIYRKHIKEVIELDSIWDWHFFAKNNFVAQDIRVWACDFFNYGSIIKDNSKGFTSSKENSTTELGICDFQSLRENNTMIKLFKKYKLDVNFDDMIIYGDIQECKVFPEFQDLRHLYIKNLRIKEVILFYNDGADVKVT